LLSVDSAINETSRPMHARLILRIDLHVHAVRSSKFTEVI